MTLEQQTALEYYERKAYAAEIAVERARQAVSDASRVLSLAQQKYRESKTALIEYRATIFPHTS